MTPKLTPVALQEVIDSDLGPAKANWVIEEVPQFQGFGVEWVGDEGFILSKRNRLYRTSSITEPLVPFCEVPVFFGSKLLSQIPLIQRSLRLFFYNFLCINSSTFFVSFAKQLGLIRQGRYHVISGLKQATRVLWDGTAVCPNGSVFFGEYRSNIKRDAIHIYHLEPNTLALKVAYIFPKSAIRHIHGIYYDRFDPSLWCITGDREHECKILCSHDKFASIETVGEGDESWRCVSLIFREDSIWYASDAEFAKNYVYRIDRETRERRTVGEIDGPVYCSCEVNGNLFFAVSAESCPSQAGPWATLWMLDKYENLKPVLRFPKDKFHVKYFMPGTIHLKPGRINHSELFIRGIALSGIKSKTYRLFLR